MSTCIRQTSASHPKFAFSPTFIFSSPICPNNCGVVFFGKIYFSFREMIFISFDCSNIQIFTVNITWVVWSPVNIEAGKETFNFLVNIFVRHTFSMSKSSIKTKTVLTMTDMTKSTELLAFKRQKDGYKVTVKIFLCNCVVLLWDELKVRQNLLASDYEIYMVCLLVATVYWHKSLQFAKKSNITLLPCLFMILLAVSIIILRLGITFWQEPRFCVVFSPPSFIS